MQRLRVLRSAAAPRPKRGLLTPIARGAQIGVTSKFGSERALAAAHNQRNQIVVASLKRRAAVRECTAGGVNQIKYVQVARRA